MHSLLLQSSPHASGLQEEFGYTESTTKAEYGPNFHSLSGLIVVTIQLSLLLSLALCLVRFDFNFVLYLMGYFIWCMDATHNNITLTADNFAHNPSCRDEFWVASKPTLRAVEWLIRLLCGAALFDSTWLYFTVPTWLCWDDGSDDSSLPSPYCAALAEATTTLSTDSSFTRLLVVHRLHRAALLGSCLLFAGKVSTLLRQPMGTII